VKVIAYLTLPYLLGPYSSMELKSFHKSERPEKKYQATLLDPATGRMKTIHFGDSNLKDYTLFSAAEREDHKRRYLARHKTTENWNDPRTAGFWSRWVLWNKPTVKSSLADVKARYNL